MSICKKCYRGFDGSEICPCCGGDYTNCMQCPPDPVDGTGKVEAAIDMRKRCKWTADSRYEYGIYDTECGHWVSIDYSEYCAGFEWKYCPYCGRHIEIKE